MANRVGKGFDIHGECLRSTPYVAGGTIYPGDLVNLGSAGTVAAATAGQVLLGLSLSYGVSGDTISVADHPDQLISGEGDETELTAQTLVGNNADHVATTGNTTYKSSKQELDSSTATNSQAGLQILRLEPSSGNAFGTNARVVCRINEHAFNSAGIAGI